MNDDTGAKRQLNLSDLDKRLRDLEHEVKQRSPNRSEVGFKERVRTAFIFTSFVGMTIILWRFFMALTWLAGKNFLWEPTRRCQPTSEEGWRWVWALISGNGGCLRLHWSFSLVLLGLALWVTTRTWFPTEYPEEKS